MQSRDGAWAAFDADNTYHYLNHIPFADHGALLDPPTADVTARCVSMLAQLGETRATSAVSGARDRRPARRSGRGWKLVRPLGHELHLRNLVRALRARRSPPRICGRSRCALQSSGSCASRTLTVVGARVATATNSRYKGFEPAPSAASQTAWALLGLMAAGEADHPAVARGVGYLAATQGRKALGRALPYRHGVPPRVLSALSWLFEVLPALGARPLSQSEARQQPRHDVRHVTAPPPPSRPAPARRRATCRKNVIIYAGFAVALEFGSAGALIGWGKSVQKDIKVAIAGVGNCASSLVQGVEYYRNRKDAQIEGVMRQSIGDYGCGDVEFVAAFDIDRRKVGQALEQAIFAKPNCTRVFQSSLPVSNVVVQAGPVLDGVTAHGRLS